MRIEKFGVRLLPCYRTMNGVPRFIGFQKKLVIPSALNVFNDVFNAVIVIEYGIQPLKLRIGQSDMKAEGSHVRITGPP